MLENILIKCQRVFLLLTRFTFYFLQQRYPSSLFPRDKERNLGKKRRRNVQHFSPHHGTLCLLCLTPHFWPCSQPPAPPVSSTASVVNDRSHPQLVLFTLDRNRLCLPFLRTLVAMAVIFCSRSAQQESIPVVLVSGKRELPVVAGTEAGLVRGHAEILAKK